MSLDLALAVFRHVEGADHAYADVRDVAGDAAWVHEIALVEHHRRDRLVVRGSFAGRYVDVEDQSDPLGKKTVVGALTGAVAGLLFGPPGFVVGLVGGGIAGGVAEAGVPELHDAFFDEIRADVPQGSSAVLLLARPDHVDAMVAAFEGHGGRLVRRHLSMEAAQALEAAVADPSAPHQRRRTSLTPEGSGMGTENAWEWPDALIAAPRNIVCCWRTIGCG